MRLIAITTPGFRENEAGEIRRLLDGGWWRVHIRKPGSDPESVVRLLREIPRGYYPRLSLHDHFPLAGEFGLGGVHLNSRNPRAPRGWNGLVSRSCHTLEEIQQGDEYDYQFLSPVFGSISTPGYLSRFTSEDLRRAAALSDRVFPLGGITRGRAPQLRAMGFTGCAMLGAAWNNNEPMLQFITHTSRGLEEVLRGGCRWVQLRIKGASDAEFAGVAREILPLCRRYGATLIFDDRVELTASLGADGVHLGKNDMPLPEARRILGSGKIIGATANTAEDIMDAFRAGADYIGLGPFRFTTTKQGLAPLLGLEGYRKIMADCRARGMNLPTVAIGGILTEDLPQLRLTGVDGIAVSGLILNSSNPEQTTKDILETWKN